MKIQLIAEGHTKQDRKSLNWGLSLLIGETVLFDAFGREDIFAQNIRACKVDMRKLRHIVISHDDWDHVAGVNWILSQRKNSAVYICRGSSQALAADIQKPGGRLHEITKPQIISKGVYSTGCLRADLSRGVIFEQSLIVQGKGGFWVIAGCAHPGIDVIVKSAARLVKEPIIGIVGGFHMKDNTVSENALIIKELHNAGVRSAVPLHCTGIKACCLLRQAFGKGYTQLLVGDMYDI